MELETTPPLPPLYESVLSTSELDALFADLGMLDGPVEVSLKRAATAHASTDPASLADARRALDQRSVRGVQLRYVHERIAWCDTLVALPTGVRLVRCALPTRPR